MKDDSHPNDHKIEYTAREQCFVPDERYNSFIRIENITFQRGGNGFSPPQRGIVSTNCGNHFIINNCTIEDANGTGLDIGFQLPSRYSKAERGHQIVSNCEFSRCGMAALCGTTGSSDVDYYDFQQQAILVYNNRFYDNCWQDFSQLHESATIKLHHLKNSLLVGNYIENNMYGHGGIWLDAANENVLISENVILESYEGGIYIEATTHSVEVSNNIIINTKIQGIRGSETDHIRCNQNIILGSGSKGIDIKYGGNRYFLGQTFTGKGVEVTSNIISHSQIAVSVPIQEAIVDKNIYGHFENEKYLEIGKEKETFDLANWQDQKRKDLNSKNMTIDYHVDKTMGNLILTIEGRKFKLEFDKSIINEISKVLNKL